MKSTIFGTAVMQLRYANLQLEKALNGASDIKIRNKMDDVYHALNILEKNSTKVGISPLAIKWWDKIFSSSIQDSNAILQISERRLCSSLKLVVSQTKDF